MSNLVEEAGLNADRERRLAKIAAQACVEGRGETGLAKPKARLPIPGEEQELLCDVTDLTQSEALINSSIALSDEITGVAERLENIANRIVGLAEDIPVEQDIAEPSATFVDRMVGQHDIQKDRLAVAREALDRIERFIV